MTRAYRYSFPLTALFADPLKIGQGRYRVKCPVHDDAHPSCIVNYHRDHGWRWHCFACGADGDALDVLTGRDGMSFREAMDFLDGSAEAWSQDRASVTGVGNYVTDQDASRHIVVLICDVCRVETKSVSSRHYGRGLREWLASAHLEAATAPGWELSAGLEFAICPDCQDSSAHNRPKGCAGGYGTHAVAGWQPGKTGDFSSISSAVPVSSPHALG